MLLRFIIYLSLLAIATTTGLVAFKRLTSPFRYLVILLIYVFLLEGLIFGVNLMYPGKGTPVYHVNSIVLIFLTAMMYSRFVVLDHSSRRLIWIVSVACFLLALSNTLFYQRISTFPSLSIVAHAFQSILLTLLVYRRMLKSPQQTLLIRQSVFWLNTGTLIYYSFNFVGFAFYNSFKDSVVITSWWFYLNWLGNLLLYSSYLIAIYLNSREQK